ncbi:carbohydrate sulfotransferase 13-like [Ruditapes philippinarum]|uniref:carbohydrate sulfotransferase 13-like n=1 Tax=Ruditapes philippinarum TaxID=129788 RepID=UPI00295AA5F2|nr:carbohydrate sulfotransferase 13-like [Ruditapes philippinarum]
MFKTKHALTEVQTERIKHLQEKCNYLMERVGRISYQNIYKHQQIYSTRNSAICVVAKSGCTFLKQIIYYLNDPKKLLGLRKPKHNAEELKNVTLLQKNVFNLARKDIHYLLNFDNVQVTARDFRKGMFLKAIVARNPYSRLYSAYLDKIYVPVFEDVFQAKYEEIISTGSKVTQLKACKDYVSFEDFLKHVLSESRKSNGNPHWLPAYSQCNACRAKPDIVIKQETYYEDIEYYLSQIDISSSEWEEIDSAIAKKGIQSDSIITGLIQTMFDKSLESELSICFSKIQIAQRIWEALQFQGQIYQNQKFPVVRLKNMHLDATSVAGVFLSQIKKMPITVEESKNQRKNALARAFRNIKPELIINIQAMFYYDFMIFNYDFEPPK